MFHSYIILIFTVTMFICAAGKEITYALVVIPVADTTGHSMKTKSKYSQLAFAPHNGDHSCPRFHQLLFNEIIKIVKERGEEVEAEFLNVFYLDLLGRKSRGFWTHKKNIVLLKELPEEIIQKAIPQTYSGEAIKNVSNSHQVLTLSWPWHDKEVTQKKYSAGTRFVRDVKYDTRDCYCIILLDDELLPVRSFIEKNLAVVGTVRNIEKQIQNYVALMRYWVTRNCTNKVAIPYVWGGCSFIKAYDARFWLEKDIKNDMYVEFWMRPEKIIPFSGLECSSLIFRAAQICNMPYYLKNSATIASCLEHVGSRDAIMNGDIIWYPGHVVVVSDVKNNKVLESAGYMLGYGKVHELPLEKMFKNIKTFQQLKEAYHNKAQLVRLDHMGENFKIIKQFKIMKIRSIWK